MWTTQTFPCQVWRVMLSCECVLFISSHLVRLTPASPAPAGASVGMCASSLPTASPQAGPFLRVFVSWFLHFCSSLYYFRNLTWFKSLFSCQVVACGCCVVTQRTESPALLHRTCGDSLLFPGCLEVSVSGFQQCGNSFFFWTDAWSSWCSFNRRLEVDGQFRPEHHLSLQILLPPHPFLFFLGSSARSHANSRRLHVSSGEPSPRPPSWGVL